MSPVLPLTVISVVPLTTGLYGVTMALADGSRRTMVIPSSLATIEGVMFSTLAYATLLAEPEQISTGHHRGHRRYDPRTAT